MPISHLRAAGVLTMSTSLPTPASVVEDSEDCSILRHVELTGSGVLQEQFV